MADARKTWAELDVLFADNTAGAISPQDLRDGFAALEPHSAAAAPGVTDDGTDGFDKGHAWIDTSTTPNAIYRCLDNSTGAAVWVKVYPADVSAAGDVTGPASSTDGNLAAFDGTDGATLKDSGKAATDFATAAQGTLAGTAMQPGDDAATLGSGAASSGDVLTADGSGGADWAAPTGGGGGGGYVGAVATLTGAQSIATDSAVAVAWDTATQTSGYAFWSSGAPTRLTIPSGKGITHVRLVAFLRWASNASGLRALHLRVNNVRFVGGTETVVSPSGPSGEAAINLTSQVIEVSDGDYFEVFAFQDSGSALDITDAFTPASFGIQVID